MMCKKSAAFLIVFLMAMLPHVISGQEHSAAGEPHEMPRLLQQHTASLMPQKIFVHLDNTGYKAGETIWFKGYLVDGVTHLPDTSNANVYVELWDAQGEIHSSLVLQPDKGVFQGNIFLGIELADGNYRLRAYTDRMLNLGDAYLFQRHLYISNPDFANVIDNNTRRFNRSFNLSLERSKSEFVVGLYPEGGHLVDGLRSRVAVRLSDASGAGRASAGEIRDESGNVVASFNTNELGFGMFEITPAQESRYVANLNREGQKAVVASLPEILPEGYVVRVDLVDDEWLDVAISANIIAKDETRLFLLGHTRGQTVIYFPDITVNETEILRFPVKDFPTGITHLTLLSDDKNVMADRLVFINHHDQVYFDMRARALRSGETTALHIDILASDRDGMPVQGDFSVSVQYAPEIERTYRENMFSYLLLSGDLTGQVEEPAYYFDFSQEDNVEKAIDMLMLANDWQRFDWQQLVQFHRPESPFTARHGVTIEGFASDPDTNLSLQDRELSLRLLADRDLSFTTRTDQHGRFSFEQLPLTDSVLVEIVSTTPGAAYAPRVSLSEAVGGGDAAVMETLEPNFLTRPQKVTERGSQWRRVRQERQPRQRLETARHSPYGNADQVIIPDRNIVYPGMIDLLRDRAVGLNISPDGSIVIRGPSSIRYQASPIFIVDGVESPGAFMALDVRDVDRVEIFKGGSSAVFGARGVNGALVVYTKKSEFIQPSRSENQFMISGLHAPEQFPLNREYIIRPADPGRTITLHWEPRFITNEEGLGSFQFFPHTMHGQYHIVIQGVSKEGKVGYGAFFLEL